MADFQVDPQIILYILIAIVIIDNFWDIILLKRQVMVCQNALFIPEELRTIIPLDIYHRARIYEMHKCELEMGKHFFEIIFGVCELYFGFYPFLWGFVAKTMSGFTTAEVWVSVFFMFMFSIYISLRLLPIVAYDRCILEVRYGPYRSVSCGLLIVIACCGTIFLQLILAPATIVIVLLIQIIGFFVFIYAWCLSIIVTIIMLFAVPLCIMPRVGSAERLPDGPLYKEIKKVTDATGFPIQNVYIVRTKPGILQSNAYFYGCLCLKRIVIFDTMLLNRGKTPQELEPYEVGRGLPNPLIAGVVAHELGHWKYGHFWKAMIIMKIHILIALILFTLLFYCPQLYEAVRFEHGLMPIIVGLIIVTRFAMTPYFTIANVLILCNLRRYEYQADRYAHQLGYSLHLRAALLKIYADNMSFPVYDHCYSMWNHTHPTLLQRLLYQQELDMRLLLNTMKAMQDQFNGE